MASRLKRMSLSIKAGFKNEGKEKEELKKEDSSPDLVRKIKRKSSTNMLYRLSGIGLTRAKSDLSESEDAVSGAYIPDEFYKMLVFLQDHITEEGLFRITGNQTKMQELKSKFGDNINFADYDPHVVSGVLKATLREMKVPLLTYEIYDWCLAIKDLGDDDNLRIAYIRKILAKCPEENLQIMDDLFGFLAQVNAQSHINKMTAGNLALVFAPCLLRARDEKTSVTKMLDDAPIVTSIIETLIQNYDLFFNQMDNHVINHSMSGTVWKSTLSGEF
eukprot:TRINITY_DN9260_c0_g1_i1.p1 TRINITY_DN9260_c0_g1~~TRINITY_DN9260_c0_g1_i1.p1  ORF type:complete len:283 (+),score=44.52 TRINITY_DN9260_c0_g1_i1:25-849(+)